MYTYKFYFFYLQNEYIPIPQPLQSSPTLVPVPTFSAAGTSPVVSVSDTSRVDESVLEHSGTSNESISALIPCSQKRLPQNQPKPPLAPERAETMRYEQFIKETLEKEEQALLSKSKEKVRKFKTFLTYGIKYCTLKF